MKATRIALASLLAATVGIAWLVGSGVDPSQLRTNGDAPDAPADAAGPVDPSGASGKGGPALAQKAATTTTAAPATTAPPRRRPRPSHRSSPARPAGAGLAAGCGFVGASGVMCRRGWRRFLAGVPDGSTIELRAGGRYRMEQTLVISGRRDLTIRGNGATFVATTPGRHDAGERADRGQCGDHDPGSEGGGGQPEGGGQGSDVSARVGWPARLRCEQLDGGVAAGGDGDGHLRGLRVPGSA